MPVRTIHCEHLGDTLERIDNEHRASEWLYRGQTRRHPQHRFDDGTRSVEFENLYPRGFRFMLEHAGVSETLKRAFRAEHVRAEAAFHGFNSFLLAKYESREPSDERMAWLRPYAETLTRVYQPDGLALFAGFRDARMALSDPRFLRLSWSLAQHYGIVAALLDATWDPGVAAWFATNRWLEAPVPAPLEGHGVIYRFALGGLTGAILTHNGTSLSLAAHGLERRPWNQAFVEDLSQLPPSFAVSPHRQQAAVISGFDVPELAILVDRTQTIDAFVFPHRHDELARWPTKHTRAELAPATDPFLELKREFDASLARWLDERDARDEPRQ